MIAGLSCQRSSEFFKRPKNVFTQESTHKRWRNNQSEKMRQDKTSKKEQLCISFGSDDAYEEHQAYMNKVIESYGHGYFGDLPIEKVQSSLKFHNDFTDKEKNIIFERVIKIREAILFKKEVSRVLCFNYNINYTNDNKYAFDINTGELVDPRIICTKQGRAMLHAKENMHNEISYKNPLDITMSDCLSPYEYLAKNVIDNATKRDKKAQQLEKLQYLIIQEYGNMKFAEYDLAEIQARIQKERMFNNKQINFMLHHILAINVYRFAGKIDAMHLNYNLYWEGIWYVKELTHPNCIYAEMSLLESILSDQEQFSPRQIKIMMQAVESIRNKQIAKKKLLALSDEK